MSVTVRAITYLLSTIPFPIIGTDLGRIVGTKNIFIAMTIVVWPPALDEGKRVGSEILPRL